MTASVLVLLAPGAEETEVLTTADYLVRGGARVTIASLADSPVVRGSRNLPLAAHALLDHLGELTPDCLILPGGKGSAEALRDDPRAQRLATAQLAAGRVLAAICAAPIALVPGRLCAGKRVTSFPGVRSQVEPHATAWLDQPVVEDGPLITGQSAGLTIPFALTLVRRMCGVEAMQRVASETLTPRSLLP